MAFEGVQFTDRMGRPVPEKLRDQLIQVVTTVLASPDADIDAVLQRAQTIAQKAADGEIGNVGHYATKALFAVARKEELRRGQEPILPSPPELVEALVGHAIDGSESAIEAQVLLRELFAKLSPIEREVYIRYAEGWEHTEIAKALGISVAMSWYRLMCAKKKLASCLKSER